MTSPQGGLLFAGGVVTIANLLRPARRVPSLGVSTISKPSRNPRRPSRSKAAPYGLKARPLPAGHAQAGDLKKRAGELGKRADWGAIESAYASRNL